MLLEPQCTRSSTSSGTTSYSQFQQKKSPCPEPFWDTLTYIAGFDQLSPILSPITNTGTCKLASLTAAFADEDRFYIIGKAPLQLPLWDTSINIWSQPPLRSHQRYEKLSLLITGWSARDNFASAQSFDPVSWQWQLQCGKICNLDTDTDQAPLKFCKISHHNSWN